MLITKSLARYGQEELLKFKYCFMIMKRLYAITMMRETVLLYGTMSNNIHEITDSSNKIIILK
jgi:hypothetical protein